MGQQRHHYEQAFEAHVRSRRVPLVSVNEARKSLLPAPHEPGDPHDPHGALKSFDYLLYGADVNLLVEIKGRRLGAHPHEPDGGARPLAPAPPSAMQNWVTRDDVASLLRWEALFGAGFCAAFVFIYWLERQPASALFEEMIEHKGRWYLLRAIAAADYQRHMRPRSERWGTVSLPAATFDRLSGPLLGPTRSPALAPQTARIPAPGALAAAGRPDRT